MMVRIDLAGFGDDRPGVFGDANSLEAALPADATLDVALTAAGLNDTPGLSVLVNERPVGSVDRTTVALRDGDHVVVLHAFEGG